ncbi:hypothetical protein M513_10438 [Trichuris suis]|uniref:Uncharacterized protein n=1 Tax=Trichuris suis TaxID=68888 RepID=A0A085LUK8_9BILA|nr:hypothetical protein M513_10438 [Trichuris suis]
MCSLLPNMSQPQRELRRDNSRIPQAATSPAHTHLLPYLLARHDPVNPSELMPSHPPVIFAHTEWDRTATLLPHPTTYSHYLVLDRRDPTAVYALHPMSTGQCPSPAPLSSVQCPSSTVQCSLTIARCPVSTVPCTHTGHTTLDMRRTTRDMRHTTLDMRHTTCDTLHTTCDILHM